MNIETLKNNVRYLTNPQGEQTDVLIPLSLWRNILQALTTETDNKAELIADLKESLIDVQNGKTYPIAELWQNLKKSIEKLRLRTMAKTISIYLTEILDRIKNIQEYQQNTTLENFENKDINFDAIVFNLSAISHFTKLIPELIKHKYQQIQWQAWADLEDDLICCYYAINPEEIWQIVNTKLEPLQIIIEQIQQNENLELISPANSQVLTAASVLQTLTEILPSLKEQYKIKKLGLFGSYSRNQATEDSDIDLLIELETDITFGFITFCHLENILKEKLGKKVDLVISENIKPSLKENILNDIIYL